MTNKPLYLIVVILLVLLGWQALSNWNKGVTIKSMEDEHLSKLEEVYKYNEERLDSIKEDRKDLIKTRDSLEKEREKLLKEVFRLNKLLIKNRVKYDKIYNNIDNANVNELVDLLSRYKFSKDSNK